MLNESIKFGEISIFNVCSGFQNNSGGRGGEERGILQLITTAC